MQRSNRNKQFLSHDDLNAQIKRMVAFIEHEAKERAEEIDSKAESEYCYEKARLLHGARQELVRVFEKKEKLVMKQALVDEAQMVNQARLRLLACREAHVSRVEAEVQDRLLKKNQELKLYSRTLSEMIFQGLLKLLEKSVVVRVREQDVSLAEGLLEPTARRYRETVGIQLKLVMDKTKHLPPSTLGGVELSTPNRRLRVNNTMNSRLQMIIRQLVPQIRKQLFK